MDSPITSVESYRFLGTTITQDLKWEPTISSLIKKAQQRMYFLRQLRKAKLPAQMLVQFYTAIIESILTSSITVWFAGATVRDKQRLQRIVRSAEEVIGRSLPSLQDLCTCGPGWTGVDCAVDVDECESDPCLNGARCQESHVPGEFHCTCPPFYRGAVCSQPFHPCDPPHNPCQHHSTCLTRSDGTAVCICSAGFEGSWCEIDTNECTSDPCHNGGFCVDGVNGYRCECKMGFFGLQCEQDVDECASNPCQNGATCQNLENMFLCTCVPGYFGVCCDLDVDECEVSPCLHQGICINKPGAFECVCRPGYSGARCEVNIDECVSNPCQNTGRCIDGQSQFHCLCSDGFIGLNCEINIDECMSAPCLHGSCVDGIGMFSCLCEQGWTGIRCEENIDDCAFSPCQNGGSCVDLIDKFACFCPDGFSGKTCENDINMCTESAHNTTLCFNSGTCVDGKGSNFTCSCPPGFTGDFCEVDFNECCSAPCHNGGICQDLINSYVCYCRSGWTGLHCEDDINECLPQPCDQGICIQNDPGYGYTCFCRPGFVGKNCEHNYDDCLLNPCPAAFSCVDGVNGVSCVAPASDTVPMETTVNTSSPSHPAAALSPRSTANVKYFGDSFLEFDGIEMNRLNDITLRFQTRSSQGTLLYMDHGPANNQFFFIKVFITEGVLKYAFNCHKEDEVTQINTAIQINDDTAHMVNIRQHLNPCEAELTLSGHSTIKSAVSNYWPGSMLQRTYHIFVGGLPLRYPLNQKAEHFDNFTGCIEIIEINNRRSFLTSDSIANSNTGECRNTTHPSDTILPRLDPSTHSYLNDSTVTRTEKSSSDEAPVCFQGLCQNGGTCYTQHHFNKSIPLCLCPLHFTGPFCEKDATVYIPRFDVDSYLELQPLVSLLRSSGDSYNLPTTNKDTTVILQLTLKTRSTQGTILYNTIFLLANKIAHVWLK
uniref:Protein eyes shut homolog n=1 Tax=Knipowitschia caucasica TaxID=637954 RepID=A0AAV2JPI9_KNICA